MAIELILDDYEPPYFYVEVTKIVKKFNSNYGDHRICWCSHEYHRHFDSYDDMKAVGCKYCDCQDFRER